MNVHVSYMKYMECVHCILLSGPLPLGRLADELPGSLIYLPYLCVHTPMDDVTRGSIVEGLVLADEHHTRC